MTPSTITLEVKPIPADAWRSLPSKALWTTMATLANLGTYSDLGIEVEVQVIEELSRRHSTHPDRLLEAVSETMPAESSPSDLVEAITEEYGWFIETLERVLDPDAASRHWPAQPVGRF